MIETHYCEYETGYDEDGDVVECGKVARFNANEDYAHIMPPRWYCADHIDYAGCPRGATTAGPRAANHGGVGSAVSGARLDLHAVRVVSGAVGYCGPPPKRPTACLTSPPAPEEKADPASFLSIRGPWG